MNGIMVTRNRGGSMSSAVIRYESINIDLLYIYWCKEMRMTAPDCFKIVKIKDGIVSEIQRGRLPTETTTQREKEELQLRLSELDTAINANRVKATEAIQDTSDFIEINDSDQHIYLLYTKSEDGLICTAWYSTSSNNNRRRGNALFATALFGQFNGNTDQTLAKATFEELPYLPDAKSYTHDAEQMYLRYRAGLIKLPVR